MNIISIPTTTVHINIDKLATNFVRKKCIKTNKKKKKLWAVKYTDIYI